MGLSPMRFKEYIWPHNPQTYEILYQQQIVSHKVPFGTYFLQQMGRGNRILRGEGEFAGADAYAEFKKLATVFYDESPGVLVHPVWQSAEAYFVSLSLKQEPREDYVRYSFEFWECPPAAVQIPVRTPAEEEPVDTAEAEWYTIGKGDTLWNIANRYGLSMAALLAMNPQIKNPNLIYPGDRIRVA